MSGESIIFQLFFTLVIKLFFVTSGEERLEQWLYHLDPLLAFLSPSFLLPARSRVKMTGRNQRRRKASGCNNRFYERRPILWRSCKPTGRPIFFPSNLALEGEREERSEQWRSRRPRRGLISTYVQLLGDLHQPAH